MSDQDTVVSDRSSTDIQQFVLHHWQALDRGWKAALLGLLIVLHHLAGGIP